MTRGHEITTELVEIAIQEAKDTLTPLERAAALEKFKTHPLLTFDRKRDIWSFQQPQVRIALIADAASPA